MKNKITKNVVTIIFMCFIILIGTLAIRYGLSGRIINKETLLQVCFMVGVTVGVIIGIVLG